MMGHGPLRHLYPPHAWRLCRGQAAGEGHLSWSLLYISHAQVHRHAAVRLLPLHSVTPHARSLRVAQPPLPPSYPSPSESIGVAAPAPDSAPHGLLGPFFHPSLRHDTVDRSIDPIVPSPHATTSSGPPTASGACHGVWFGGHGGCSRRTSSTTWWAWLVEGRWAVDGRLSVWGVGGSI